MNWLRAGALYFLLVFTLGTVLGVARITIVAPRIGATGALLAELPLMLLGAWFICRAILRRIEVPRTLRLAMGAAFLLLLLASEAILAALFGSFAGGFGRLALAGLLAQILSALFPRLQAAR